MADPVTDPEKAAGSPAAESPTSAAEKEKRESLEADKEVRKGSSELDGGKEARKGSYDLDDRRRSSVVAGRARMMSVQHETHDIQEGQVFSMNDIDPALDAKMRLVNQAIEEIGFTTMHVKLFFLNGFGYFADSLILLLQSVTATQAAYEFQPTFKQGLTAASYTGMLVGALFWGMGADIIGRRIAFNCSLFICAVFAIVATASPNWIVLGLFTSLSAFGAGGNLVLDTTVFLEFLPGKYQWLVTFMACWWGLAPVIVASFAWPLLSLPQYYCASAETCTYDNNKVISDSPARSSGTRS